MEFGISVVEYTHSDLPMQRTSSSCLLTALLVALLALCAGPSAAQVWQARGILASTDSSRVRLIYQKDGVTHTADTVERAWIDRMVVITDRMASAFGIQAPRLVITHSTDPNAFAGLQKGVAVLGVNTAMLRLAGGDDDLMATVIGHELGHLKANHATEGAARQGLVSLLGILAGLAVDYNQAKRGVDTQGAGMLLGSIGGDLFNAKFSRDQEREADDLGLRAMTQAGYNPHAAVNFWREMARRTSGGSGFWMSSHPSHDERERSLAVAAAALRPANTVNSALASLAQPQTPDFTTFLMTALPSIEDKYATSTFVSIQPPPSETSIYANAWAAYKAARYEESFTGFQRAADDGDVRGLAMVGDSLALGRGVEKNPTKAFELYKSAAELGFAPAMYALGDSFARGHGVERDHTVALRWFLLARGRGVPGASSRLGLQYLRGEGVDKNAVIARHLAEEANARNHALGTALLGALLRDGQGGPADPERGFRLLKSSTEASPGVGYAHFQLAVAYETGKGTPPNRELAIEQYRKALAAGASDARGRLSRLGISE